MIDNRKRRLYVKLILLLICLIIIIRIFTLVLSKYESESNSSANVDIAFYLLKEDYKEMTLNLASLFPQDDEYVFTFSIGNEDGIKVAETDLEYDLTLRTTTNLPLTYELYMTEDSNYTNATNIIQENTIEQDENNTYFRTMTTNKETLYYKEPKTNTYQLVVHFPANYNTTNYQDIIEALEIKVEAKQVI